MRLNPDGSIDPAFGPGGADGDGITVTPTRNFPQRVDIDLLPDGRIVVGATDLVSSNFAMVVARYHADGSIDAAFGPGGTDGDGVVTAQPRAGAHNSFSSVAFTPDGGVLAVGTAYPVGGGIPDAFLLVKLRPDGTGDPAFGTGGNGVVSDAFFSRGAEARDVLVEPDGRIVIAGHVARAAATPEAPGPVLFDGAVARYLADGRRDSGFDGDGLAAIDFGAEYSDSVWSLARRPGGGYLFAGETVVGTGTDTAYNVALASVRADGSPDDDFAPGGLALTNLGSPMAVAREIAPAPGGKIVLIGRTAGADPYAYPQRPTLARLVGAGLPAPGVRGRHVFYNRSALDGGDPAATAGDDAAIAIDKQPLLPGQAASAVNVTGYSRGINGLMIDVAGLDPAAEPTLADLELHVGDGATWAPAPAASVSVRRGAGTGGADRVTLTFPDGAVRNTWLRVTVRATAVTHFTEPDVFYFGNLVGETATDAGAAPAVDAADLARIRRNLFRTTNDATAACDLDRDGSVDADDLLLARANQGHRLTVFTASTTPAPSAPLPAFSSPRRPSPTPPRRAAWIETPGTVLGS
jgi:uncharacterized delta-60 repeat protein